MVLNYKSINTQFQSRNGGIFMKTLREFWNDFDGVVDFFNKNGEEIDDMNYPLETEILEEKETSTEYWQVVLNV